MDIINTMSNGQRFDIAHTTKNGGLVSIDTVAGVVSIRVIKNGVAEASKDVGFEAISGDFGNPFVYTGGSANAVTIAKKALGVVSVGTSSIRLSAGKVTKSSGLEIDFAGFATPRVGDSIMLRPDVRVIGDDYLVNRNLFVISITGTKVKLMSEVPTAMAIDSSSPISAIVYPVAGGQRSFKYGIDVTSTSRSGNYVTLKGSHAKMIGMSDALGALRIDEDSPLIVPVKKKSGQMKQFTIVSMDEGAITVLDEGKLIVEQAIGSKVIGTAMVVPVGGFTLISGVSYRDNSGSDKTTIDLTKLTGSVAGDTYVALVTYGGDI